MYCAYHGIVDDEVTDASMDEVMNLTRVGGKELLHSGGYLYGSTYIRTADACRANHEIITRLPDCSSTHQSS